MKRVEFYILEPQSDKVLFASELTAALYEKKRHVFIQCDNQKMAEHFDNVLWGNDNDSFIPHNIQGEGPTPPPPVQIGYQDNAKGFYDTLLLLSNDIPEFHSQFKTIIEIVDGKEETKARLRQHYRQYQTQGYQVNNIKEAQCQWRSASAHDIA